MKYSKRRCRAAILSAALAFTMLPAPLANAAELSAPLPAAETQAIEDTNLLADFDFNTDPQDGKFTSKDAVAAIVGAGATLQDRDADQGKALYLDGSASYLDVKKSDNSSLLTGLKELTISFEAKPDRTSTNWGFYAAPNADRQGVNGEHYIGALINGGTTTLERYHQSGSRPRSASAATGTDWTHVDAVFSETDTTIYLDGVKVSAEASNYALTDILGQASIFQIGKANWGNGEYTAIKYTSVILGRR